MILEPVGKFQARLDRQIVPKHHTMAYHGLQLFRENLAYVLETRETGISPGDVLKKTVITIALRLRLSSQSGTLLPAIGLMKMATPVQDTNQKTQTQLWM